MFLKCWLSRPPSKLKQDHLMWSHSAFCQTFILQNSNIPHLAAVCDKWINAGNVCPLGCGVSGWGQQFAQSCCALGLHAWPANLHPVLEVFTGRTHTIGFHCEAVKNMAQLGQSTPATHSITHPRSSQRRLLNSIFRRTRAGFI